MAAHETYKKVLEEWLAQKLVDSINFRYLSINKTDSEAFAARLLVLHEVSVRAKNAAGDEVEGYRIDTVIFVNPRVTALKNRETYTIGIEIKGEYGDLMSDRKMQYYLGHTDFFFIGVPQELVPIAENKVAELLSQYPSSEGRVGVLNMDTGLVVLWPKRQSISLDCRFRIHEAALWGLCHDRVQVAVPDADIEDLEGIPLDNADSTITLMLADKLLQRKARLVRSRIARDEQYKEAAERAKELVPSVRTALGTMLPADNVVFWAIRDATATGGIDAKVVAEQTQQSDSCVTRAIRKLREAGMVKLDGSKKTGKFVTINEANESSRCLNCVHAAECDGNSLMCGSYEATDTATTDEIQDDGNELITSQLVTE